VFILDSKSDFLICLMDLLTPSVLCLAMNTSPNAPNDGDTFSEHPSDFVVVFDAGSVFNDDDIFRGKLRIEMQFMNDLFRFGNRFVVLVGLLLFRLTVSHS